MSPLRGLHLRIARRHSGENIVACGLAGVPDDRAHDLETLSIVGCESCVGWLLVQAERLRGSIYREG